MKGSVIIILIIAAVIAASSAMFIVDQREQVIVLQFGAPVSVVREPGLNFKIPFVQEVRRYDRRVLDLNAEPQELTASDKKQIIVDAFAKYRISNPLEFYKATRHISHPDSLLTPILDSRLREVIANYPLISLLTIKRSEIMSEIRGNLSKEFKDFGIEVVDVRIMRADLPEKNSQTIFQRMQTERVREAKEFRAQGAEEAKIITSTAEKERTILLAEAEKKAQIIRGAGEAEATRIFAESFGRDQDFYTFYRSMQAYKETLGKNDTTMVLSPDSEFLRYFGDIDGGGE